MSTDLNTFLTKDLSDQSKIVQSTTHMNIILTYECNRNCPGCISNAHKNNDSCNKFLEMDDVEKAIEFAKEKGIKTVVFTGGEPTVHPKIIEIATLFHNNGFETGMYTNYDFQDIVKQLDGVIDHIFVSYYGQEMPRQNEFKKSSITITTLLYKDYFKNIEDLDKFIDKYKDQASLKFTVPINVNNYVDEHIIDFLDSFSSEILLFPDNSQFQLYRGFSIRRADLGNKFYVDETIPWKVHPNGDISRFYSNSTARLAEKIEDPALREKVLSTHNPKQRKEILKNQK